MLDVTEEASQESRHNVEVAEVSHKLSLLHKEVEIAGQLHDLRHVVVRILLISCVLDTIDERDEVLVGNRELVEESILLEKTEAKVDKDVLSHGVGILKHVKVPLLKVLHQLEDQAPLARVDIHNLT